MAYLGDKFRNQLIRIKDNADDESNQLVAVFINKYDSEIEVSAVHFLYIASNAFHTYNRVTCEFDYVLTKVIELFNFINSTVRYSDDFMYVYEYLLMFGNEYQLIRAYRDWQCQQLTNSSDYDDELNDVIELANDDDDDDEHLTKNEAIVSFIDMMYDDDEAIHPVNVLSVIRLIDLL